jgi:hypothetical protein
MLAEARPAFSLKDLAGARELARRRDLVLGQLREIDGWPTAKVGPGESLFSVLVRGEPLAMDVQGLLLDTARPGLKCALEDIERELTALGVAVDA